jgi:hypothetical protein
MLKMLLKPNSRVKLKFREKNGWALRRHDAAAHSDMTGNAGRSKTYGRTGQANNLAPLHHIRNNCIEGGGTINRSALR